MRDLTELPNWERALSARILVCITFFYRAPRLCFLAEVLRSLSQFPVAAMDVIVLTNTRREEELNLLRRLCGEVLAETQYHIQICNDLQNPRDLPWQHKAIIAAEFGPKSENRHTHFIYLEDDIPLSSANFLYFVTFRDKLRAARLLPAFVRTEYNTAMGGLVSSDAFWSVYVPGQPYLRLGAAVCVNMPNPYNPCFILDSELAAEYVGSRSFDRAGSLDVCQWGLMERAAMGLCLENVPAPFYSRYVVPVHISTNAVPPYARIAHLPNNYADDPNSVLGKVRVDELFAGADELSDPDSWAGGDLVRPKWTKLIFGRCRNRSLREQLRIGVEGSLASGAEPPSLGAGAQSPGSCEQYYLVSHHDTILYFQEESHRFRHAPFGIAPFNLILEVGGEWGRLIVSPERSVAECQIEMFPDGRIGIKIGQMYLGAEWGGAAKDDKTWCRDWERFRIIRAETIEALALLRSYSWVCHDNRQIISLADQPNDFGREVPTEGSALAQALAPSAIEQRRELVFGPARLRIVGTDRAVLLTTPGQYVSHVPAYLEILNPSGLNHRFSRFMPLVFFLVEGDDSNFELLRGSLCSLETYGYCGAVFVRCSLTANELAKFIPKAFHHRLIVSPQLRSSPQLERSKSEQQLTEDFQPILRCKPGLIFNSSIIDLLVEMLLQGKQECAAEDLGQYIALNDDGAGDECKLQCQQNIDHPDESGGI